LRVCRQVLGASDPTSQKGGMDEIESKTDYEADSGTEVRSHKAAKEGRVTPPPLANSLYKAALAARLSLCLRMIQNPGETSRKTLDSTSISCSSLSEKIQFRVSSGFSNCGCPIE